VSVRTYVRSVCMHSYHTVLTCVSEGIRDFSPCECFIKRYHLRCNAACDARRGSEKVFEGNVFGINVLLKKVSKMSYTCQTRHTLFNLLPFNVHIVPRHTIQSHDATSPHALLQVLPLYRH